MSTRIYFAGVISAVLAVVTATGCGGGPAAGTIQVTGVVKLDGKPLEGATVAFLPKEGGLMATTDTDATGKFTLNATAGNNAVTVAKAAPPGTTLDPYATVPAEGPPPAPPEGTVVPAKYADPKSSGLAIVVAGGMTEINLDLTSK